MENIKLNEDSTQISQLFLTRVYYAAKDGMAIILYNLLSSKDAKLVNVVINQKVLEEDGQHCTPLIIAARYGRDKVVKILLDKFKPDLEQEGTVKFDGYVIEKATALWCAAGAGHLTVVKILVKAGANVNHPTKSLSTPLRAACFDGRLDIVKYLIEHNADINIFNQFNNTCLMIAAHKGHLDIVTFLLQKGANPNEKANCDTTALHLAAERGYTNIISELLKYGTNMTKNVRGMTPLIAAAERTRAEVVEYLIKYVKVTREEAIEAYELLGASYANDERNYCLTKAYKYLWKAMKHRFRDPDNIIYKKLGKSIKAYDNWKECDTLEKLKSIRNNQNAIHMESLVIRERILGQHNPKVPHHIIFRGAVFADSARFDRCIDLWLHALYLKQLNNIPVVKDLLRFAQVFSQMIHVGVDLEFSQVLNVLEACVTELTRNKSKLNNPDSEEDIEQHIEEMESNITTTLYILTILTKLLTLNESKYEEQDKNKAYQLVHKLCALQLRLKDGQTLLHLAVNAATLVDDFHTNHVCKFPCAATTKLLICCGADVNAMDNERNTPLHIIVSYREPVSDFMTLHSIIMDLIEAGAHMDTVNSNGKTPYDAVATGVAEIILRTQTKLSLKCMAAKVVNAYNLSYYGNVPRSLESFIELHGPGPNQG
ncbi:protein fem-1 homolog B [Bombus vosnesenskii]|uniref:Protein fem-1 homolog B n=1 Tax=Bombus vosnesenskii TaxID=207650 RepID=A0A6J3K0I7_9HYME|nr:protein fem-1 homolog B [Bombus vosnesenskii]XP_043590254.1 protein fem-1 homolog B [Bombus pyrosoma]XP_050473758.1 protein fem-1 homolog B [Bombus huntii]